MIAYDETHQIITTEQVSLVLGDRFVISFQEDAASDVFNGLREKIKIKGSKIRNNKADFLFYSLLDAIVDHYFVVMEKTGEKIQILEENLGVGNDQESLHSINTLRKDLILLKRSVNPVRDLISGILRSDTEWIEEKTMKYFKDVHDHIIQANELVENYRDMVVNTHDLYMNNINLRLNESMKVMTIVTCLLAPATVIGGIFGMNFEVIPYMHDKRGFFLASGVMVVIPIFMFLYFRKKKWF
jgi:magnesium transporter